MAVTRTFGSLDPGDLFIATDEINTDLVPMRKNRGGKTARQYERGGDVRLSTIELWAGRTDVEFGEFQPVIKLKIAPD